MVDPCDCEREATKGGGGSPRYALELSGGLRTFLMTWPALHCRLVGPNGGRGNWWLGIEAPYDGRTQSELAKAALGLVADWDHARVYEESAAATCAFYGLEAGASCEVALTFPDAIPSAQNSGLKVRGFAHQWEAVFRAHAALRASSAHDTVEYIVRTRPDVLLLSPLAMGRIGASLTASSASALLPCKFAADRHIDDFVVATPEAMDAYAAKWPMDEWIAERHVPRALDSFRVVFETVGHVILDYGFSGKFVRAGDFLPPGLHGRCKGKPLPPSSACPGMKLPGFNMSHYQMIKAHVRSHGPDARTPGLDAKDVMKALNVV